MVGLYPGDAEVHATGSVRFEGAELLGKPTDELAPYRGAQISYLMQDPRTSLNPYRSVRSQLVRAIRLDGYDKPQAERRALELLEMVQLPDARRWLHATPGELSGGMAQRVAIAIAISRRPKLLIADEPTTSLDVTVRNEILDLLQRLRVEQDLSLILVSHDLGVVRHYAEDVAIMYAGKLVELAETERLFVSPEHPYTQALIGSVPPIDDRQDRLTSIKGTPPDAHDDIPGCPFHPRCPYRVERCFRDTPPLMERRRREPDGSFGRPSEAACWVDTRTGEEIDDA
jgi:oligopeptide/dipeptide ABC transporter ATP-binding protein